MCVLRIKLQSFIDLAKKRSYVAIILRSSGKWTKNVLHYITRPNSLIRMCTADLMENKDNLCSV